MSFSLDSFVLCHSSHFYLIKHTVGHNLRRIKFNFTAVWLLNEMFFFFFLFDSDYWTQTQQWCGSYKELVPFCLKSFPLNLPLTMEYVNTTLFWLIQDVEFMCSVSLFELICVVLEIASDNLPWTDVHLDLLVFISPIFRGRLFLAMISSPIIYWLSSPHVLLIFNAVIAQF